MSDHIAELLNAYLDGELNSSQRRKVEAHLENCPRCVDELEALEALSGTLDEVHLPEFSSPEQLAANVALRLPRTPVKAVNSRKLLDVGWWLMPVGLIVVWFFLSTFSLASDLIDAASNVGLVDEVSIFVENTVNYSAFLGRVGLLDADTLQWLTPSESFVREFLGQLFWQVALAMLYLSWIAIWWARQTRPGQNRQFGN